MCEDNKDRKIICIILDRRYRIKYANIGNKYAINYVKSLDIRRLSYNLPVQYNLEDYNIVIDKINITGNIYYLITAVSLHPECKNCRKALTDEVTGLYNRNYFEQMIRDATLRPRSQNFSLILIDVDNLKEVNDTFGHIAGDKVIEIVGQAIKKCIRKGDVALRYGGDEFIILLFDEDKKAAYRVIGRIRKEINKLALEQRMDIQISAGTAYYNSLRNMGDIIKMADRDLYKEKQIKKSIKRQNGEKLKGLILEIEKLRDKLNKKVQEGKGLHNEETLKLSQELDKLIAKYFIG